MNADLNRNEMRKLTENVIHCAFTVSNTLGCGFLEKVYENALAHELCKASFEVQKQHGITVYYDGVAVGEYTADLLVEGVLLIELKAVKDLDDIDLALTQARYFRCNISKKAEKGSKCPLELRIIALSQEHTSQ